MDEPAQDSNQQSVVVFFRVYKVPILLGAFSLFCIIIALVLLVKTSQSVVPIRFSRADETGSALGTASASLAGTMVDIEGAVAHPGIVVLPGNSRVEDAIVAAGGLTNTADENYVAQNINRAMKVVDGMKLYVPTKAETSHNGDSYGRPNGTSYNLDNQSSGQSQNGAVVSVNLASKDQLDSLPGVGPVTAQKIIDNRPYANLDDLVAKKAIGPSLFGKIKSQLSL